MSSIKVAAILLCFDEDKCLAKRELNSILPKKEFKSALKITAEELVGARFYEVIAVLGHQRFLLDSELKGLHLKIVFNKFYERGLHSSIKSAIMNLNLENDFFAICFGDQLLLQKKDYNKLIAAAKMDHDALMICPTYQGIRGKPILFSKLLIPEILDHEDTDSECKYLFERYPEKIHYVEMDSDAFIFEISL